MALPAIDDHHDRASGTHLGIGSLVDYRYRILSCIGGGSMGKVYLCEHMRVPGARVALKVLAPCSPRYSSEDIRRRFLNELSVTYRVAHQNVIRTFDFIEIGGSAAFTMEYAAQGDLRRVIETTPLLSREKVLHLLLGIGEGLEAIHAEGIIHRDIKPENILITAHGIPKITDFGLAQVQGATTYYDRRGIVGTIDYLSPEYLLNGEVSQRADLYAFATLAYQMLTGQLPFQHEVAYGAIRRKVEAEVPPAETVCADLPEGLCRWLMAGLRRDPQLRMRTAHAMCRALQEEIVALGYSLHSQESSTGTALNVACVTESFDASDELPFPLESVMENASHQQEIAPPLMVDVTSSVIMQQRLSAAVAARARGSKFRRALFWCSLPIRPSPTSIVVWMLVAGVAFAFLLLDRAPPPINTGTGLHTRTSSNQAVTPVSAKKM